MCCLFLSKVNLHRNARKIPLLAHVVLQEATIRLADILRQIHEEGELRRRRGQLRDVLDLDVLTLGCGGREKIGL